MDNADLRNEVHSAARKAAPGVEALARFGYFAKGVVYVLLGLWAARAAFETGREAGAADQQGVLARVGEQPFGQVMLVLLGVGLAGYALWHVVRALLDPERHGSGPKAWAKRAGYGLSAAAHLGLAGFAFSYATQGGAARDGNSEEGWAARLLRLELGEWLIAAAGLGLLALALSQFYIAWRASFLKRLRFDHLSEAACRTLTRLGQVGIAARGVVLALVAVFLLEAAWTQDPQRAGGIAEALRLLETRPAGPWLLGAVALGLFAYGVFVVAQGRYRIIPVQRG